MLGMARVLLHEKAERATARLIFADCLDPREGMPSLAKKSVDVVLCDPPYSEHVHNHSRRGRKTKTKIDEKSTLGFAHLTQQRMDAIAAELARIARRWVLVFCDVESSTAWTSTLVGAGLTYVRTGAWVKIAATPQFSGDRPAAGFEAVVICHPRGKKRWNGGGRPALWTHPIVGHDGERRYMSTQKPKGLMDALVRQFSDRGDLICDPFVGSGSTAVSALGLGRNFIGWEREPRAHGIAARRIGLTKEQLDLFERGRP